MRRCIGVARLLVFAAMIIRKYAYPRGALVGNPSDGYFGKTLALTFSNFRAEVILYETPELKILPNTRDHSIFDGIRQLAEDVRLFGYYGGIRLLKALVKKFYDYCREHGIALHERNFTIRYSSDIPHLVGLAGSSAIITAGLRALCEFYDVAIPLPVRANLVLAVEREELMISAGLQDRVVQSYQGLVYMDFDREHMQAQGYGRYERMDPGALPNLYVAYRADLSEGSEVVHNDLRERFERDDPAVAEAMVFWAELTDRVRNLLEAGRGAEIGPLLNSNFDRRAAICRISEGNTRMIEAARSVGASAKFTGSGGAIIGTYEDEAMYAKLAATLEPLDIRVIQPRIARAETEAARDGGSPAGGE
jgi:glucuronokinase